MAFKKIILWGFLFTMCVAALAVYKIYDPLTTNFFPRCPFNVLTGFLCPGCGSQRSIHHLLNLDMAAATRENMLLVFSIPYIFTGFAFDFSGSQNAYALKWRKVLFGRTAIFLLLALIGAFWIVRNIIMIYSV